MSIVLTRFQAGFDSCVEFINLFIYLSKQAIKMEKYRRIFRTFFGTLFKIKPQKPLIELVILYLAISELSSITAKIFENL